MQMDDLISRQAVLSLAKDVTLEGGAKHRCVDATEICLLPSAQQMKDTIYRQAAIEAIENIDPSIAWLDYAADVIKVLPSAQPEPHWISCDDSNPNIDMSFPHSDVYLVTYDSGEMDVARWSNVNPFWTDHVTEPRWWGVQFANVIAWMPMPKPYKG